MNTWAPVWSGLVDSSIWSEPDYVCKIFITMLALKDADHVYRGSAYQLAQRAKKTEKETLEALAILASPDRRREEPQPFEGRRIQGVEDGWLVLNGMKYRDMVRKEAIKAKNRRSQKAWRERQALSVGSGPLTGESANSRSINNGLEPTPMHEDVERGLA